MILVDTREPDSILNGLKGAKIPKDEKIIKCQLPVGDILINTLNRTLPTNLAEFVPWADKSGFTYQLESVIENPQQVAVELLMPQSVVIERKTPLDFLESIKDGRLFDQTRRLVEDTKYPMVAITGFFHDDRNGVMVDERATKWSWWSIQMAMVRLQYAGCAVVQMRESELPEVVTHLWNFLYEGPKLVRKKAPAPLIPLPDEEEFLCGIPSIGPTKAHEVLQYTGNLMSALHFLLSEDTPDLPSRPEGFGKATIEKIRKFFGYPNIDDVIIE